MAKMRSTYTCIVTMVYKKKVVEVWDRFSIKQLNIRETFAELEKRADAIFHERTNEVLFTPKKWEKWKKSNRVALHLIETELDKY